MYILHVYVYIHRYTHLLNSCLDAHTCMQTYKSYASTQGSCIHGVLCLACCSQATIELEDLFVFVCPALLSPGSCNWQFQQALSRRIITTGFGTCDNYFSSLPSVQMLRPQGPPISLPVGSSRDRLPELARQCRSRDQDASARGPSVDGLETSSAQESAEASFPLTHMMRILGSFVHRELRPTAVFFLTWTLRVVWRQSAAV